MCNRFHHQSEHVTNTICIIIINCCYVWLCIGGETENHFSLIRTFYITLCVLHHIRIDIHILPCNTIQTKRNGMERNRAEQLYTKNCCLFHKKKERKREEKYINKLWMYAFVSCVWVNILLDILLCNIPHCRRVWSSKSKKKKKKHISYFATFPCILHKTGSICVCTFVPYNDAKISYW